MIPALLLSCSKSKTDVQNLVNSVSSENELTAFDTSSLSKGLVAFYPFKKNLFDYSGNNHNGTAVGTAIYVPDHKGKPNSALQLGSARIVTDNFFNFKMTDTFSISVWFTSDINNAGGRLLSTECPEGNFRVSSYGGGVYAWQLGSAQYYIYDTVASNTWNYLVYTYKKGKVQLYKNGVLKYSGTNSSTDALNYCAPFTIGAKASPSYDMWQGNIENLRVYNRVLTKTEINYLFKH